jgi:hypothetical protein
MEKKPYLSRRDVLKLAFVGAGFTTIGVSFGKWILDSYNEIEADYAPPEGVQQNFVVPESTATRSQTTPEATQTTQKTETSTPTPEVKPLVDQFKIAEKIDLSSGDPMKWLLVTKDNQAILTPSAKPYGYSIENENNNMSDWQKNTTYTYLEEHNLPVVWGHSGVATLFFDHWADILRKPYSGILASREDAQKAMLEKIIGAKVFMFQSADANLLPETPEKMNSLDSSVKMVEAKIVAGVFIPRWQKVSEVDNSGDFTDKSQVTFDGSGSWVDFVTAGYNKHTMDIVNWIQKIYPDDPKDNGQTNKLFSSLPNPNLVMAKFCVRAFLGDPPAPDLDANGNSVVPASYGRFVMALEIKKI